VLGELNPRDVRVDRSRLTAIRHRGIGLRIEAVLVCETARKMDVDDCVGSSRELVIDARVRAQDVGIAHAEYSASLENLSTSYLRKIGHGERT
jgi:hypothetical protein